MELEPDQLRTLITELLRGAETAAPGHHTPDPALGEFSQALARAIDACSKRSLHLGNHAQSIADRAATYLQEVEDSDQEFAHTLSKLT